MSPGDPTSGRTEGFEASPMWTRFLAGAVAVAVAGASFGPSFLPALGLRPAVSSSESCPTRAKACCCDPCPGPPVCPCDHGDSQRETVCANRSDDRSLASPETNPPSPVKAACELPERPEIDLYSSRRFPPEFRPRTAPSAEPPDKVPIA